MIILPGDVEKHKDQLGAKTLNLKKLKDLGLNVPAFVALPSGLIAALGKENKNDGPQLKSLAQEITSTLKSPLFAVRSSALIEDSAKSSYAGQFLTKINIAPKQLGEAILAVIFDAHKKLNGKLELFSIIVQEYVIADYAGVTFTRNPQNGREMVVEYAKGVGEKIVGGQVLPKRLEFYWDQPVPPNELSGLKTAVENFKRIESVFKLPQDIEWCVKGKSFFYLQTRPVTTLSASTHEENFYLDFVLPKNKKYIFEKTEISEIAPRPSPFTLSLLEKIYAQSGPVSKVYKKFGITFMPTNFLRIFGNELYVDRELEIKSLLPSFSHFNNSFQPKFSTLSGFFTTIKNIFKLNLLALNYSALAKAIKAKLDDEQGMHTNSLHQTVAAFLVDYEIIFEINLLAEKAVKKLQLAVKKDSLNAGVLLSLPGEKNLVNIEIKNGLALEGNSLEISDRSKFTNRLASTTNPLPSWDVLNSLPQWKQTYLKPVIQQAQTFNKLREYGRWLTVKNINILRQQLYSIASNHKFNNPNNIFFFSIQELSTKKIQEEVGNNRRLQHEEYNKFNLPVTLTSTLKKRTVDSTLTGVSPGIAEGVLVSANNLKSGQKAILYTKILSPDLSAHFPYIQAIVSEKGGLLSHLAIMARENKIPVVVNFHLDESKIRLGDKVILNANLGTIELLEKLDK